MRDKRRHCGSGEVEQENELTTFHAAMYFSVHWATHVLDGKVRHEPADRKEGQSRKKKVAERWLGGLRRPDFLSYGGSCGCHRSGGVIRGHVQKQTANTHFSPKGVNDNW